MNDFLFRAVEKILKSNYLLQGAQKRHSSDPYLTRTTSHDCDSGRGDSDPDTVNTEAATDRGKYRHFHIIMTSLLRFN